MHRKGLTYVWAVLLALFAAAVAVATVEEVSGQHDDDSHSHSGRIVVANRGSGSISVIEPRGNRLLGTHPLPPGALPPEPMYVVDGGHGRVLVGDRANDRVVVLDKRTFRALGSVPAGKGVFHMSASEGREQLWVNNDLDKTSTVIDLRSLTVITTVPMPADLVAQGGIPHDVVLDPHHGRFAYVTMNGLPGPDYLVKFSTESFQEVGRVEVGDNPHVAIDDRFEQLFVPSDRSNLLQVFDTGTLEPLGSLSVPGAHGAGMLVTRNRFYTTNLPGGGAAALFTIDTKSRSIIGTPVDTPFPTPHNVALTEGRKLFVTHSGAAADQVSVFRTSPRTGVPEFEDIVTVGKNPFGIAFVP